MVVVVWGGPIDVRILDATAGGSPYTFGGLKRSKAPGRYRFIAFIMWYIISLGGKGQTPPLIGSGSPGGALTLSILISILTCLEEIDVLER